MFHVNPSEIEELILSIEGVVQVAVIGIPDLEFDCLAKAVVVKKEGFESLKEQDIVDYVAQRMPSHKQLHAGAVFMDELPTTVSGKVMKRILVDKLTALESPKEDKHNTILRRKNKNLFVVVSREMYSK